MASDEQAKAHHIEDLIPIHLAAPLIAVQAIFLVAGMDLTKHLRIAHVLRYPCVGSPLVEIVHFNGRQVFRFVPILLLYCYMTQFIRNDMIAVHKYNWSIQWDITS